MGGVVVVVAAAAGVVIVVVVRDDGEGVVVREVAEVGGEEGFFWNAARKGADYVDIGEPEVEEVGDGVISRDGLEVVGAVSDDSAGDTQVFLPRDGDAEC